MSAEPRRPLTPAEQVLLVRLARLGSMSEWELDHVALHGLIDLGLVGRVDAYRAHLVTVTAEGVDAACEIAGEEEQP